MLDAFQASKRQFTKMKLWWTCTSTRTLYSFEKLWKTYEMQNGERIWM